MSARRDRGQTFAAYALGALVFGVFMFLPDLLQHGVPRWQLIVLPILVVGYGVALFHADRYSARKNDAELTAWERSRPRHTPPKLRA